MELTAHAYVIRGGENALQSVMRMLEKSGIETKGNPDVFARSFASFSMEDARALRERAALRATGERGRIFVVAAPAIAPDAQNALLKTFEEPPAGAKFFLLVPSPEMLLPTLRSRIQVLDLDGAREESVVDIKEFLRSAPEKRIELLKPFTEKGDDDKRDISGAIVFLSQLEKALSAKPEERKKSLHAIYRARKYITDRGALTKALLEQAALIIPKVL